MILKPREDSRETIDRLESLLGHPGADSHVKHQIEQQILNIRRGDLGESQAAFNIDVDFGQSPNWVVIHDLRLEHGGVVAQIDHLLINRVLDIWVLESKRFSGGIKIDERGECLTFSGNRPIAVDSPIEQNRRHTKILQYLLDSGSIRFPMRLGRQIRPKLHSLVLISGGRISRPRTPVSGIETVVKTDQVCNMIRQKAENGNPLELMKLVSSETLTEIGQQLCALHRSIQFNWEKRMRIKPAQPKPSQGIVTVKEVMQSPATEAADIEQPEKAKPPTKVRPPTPCNACGDPVSPGVRSYCMKNAQKFDSKILCMPCQAKRGPATTLP